MSKPFAAEDARTFQEAFETDEQTLKARAWASDFRAVFRAARAYYARKYADKLREAYGEEGPEVLRRAFDVYPALIDGRILRNLVLLTALCGVLRALHYEKVSANLLVAFGSPDTQVSLSQKASVHGFGFCSPSDVFLTLEVFAWVDYKSPNYLVVNAAHIEGEAGDAGLTRMPRRL